jgi:hypothetical protein
MIGTASLLRNAVGSSARLRVVLALGIVALAHGRTIGEGAALKLVGKALRALGEESRSVHVGHWSYPWAPDLYSFVAWRPNPGIGPS